MLTCRFTLPSAPTAVNIQALGIIQNYLADGTLADLSNAVEKLGEARLMSAIQTGLSQGMDKELRVAVRRMRRLRLHQALRVLVNLCWGNILLRQMVVRNNFIVSSLVDSLVSTCADTHGLANSRTHHMTRSSSAL